MCEAHRALYVRYIRTHHYYYLSLEDQILLQKDLTTLEN